MPSIQTDGCAGTSSLSSTTSSPPAGASLVIRPRLAVATPPRTTDRLIRTPGALTTTKPCTSSASYTPPGVAMTRLPT